MKLHRIARALAAISCAALVATGPVVHAQCSTQTINYGDLVSCSISPSGETDTFLLPGKTGENIWIRAARKGGNFWPGITLIAPNGQAIAQECGNPTATIGCADPQNNGCLLLPMDGLYTIQIADCFNGTITGSYNLMVQRANDPVGAPLVDFGTTQSGSLAAAEGDFYQLDVEAGDQMLVRASRTSGNVHVGTRILDPQGFVLTSDCGDPTAEIGCNSTANSNCFVAPVTGRYKIVVLDCFNGTISGGYNLYTQRLNRPEGAVPMCVGDIESGSLVATEADTYEFTSLIGSIVTIRASRTGGNMWPGLRLLDSSGNVIETACGDPQAEIASFQVATNEPYRILVVDCFNGAIGGSYNVQVVCNSGLCLFDIYCTAKTNSCGTLPSIGFSGTPSASASSGFVVSTMNTNAGKVGILLYTDAGRAAIPFQGGTLCLGSPIRRTIPIAESTGNPPMCDGRLEIDMNAFAAGALGGNPLPALLVPGTRVNTQFWGRDTPNTSLLSNAFEYFVCP